MDGDRAALVVRLRDEAKHLLESAKSERSEAAKGSMLRCALELAQLAEAIERGTVASPRTITPTAPSARAGGGIQSHQAAREGARGRCPWSHRKPRTRVIPAGREPGAVYESRAVESR
jgi:hypothetical protein